MNPEASRARVAPSGEPGAVDVLALIDHFALGGAEILLTRFAAAAVRGDIRLSVACLESRDGNPAAAPLAALGLPPVNLNLPGRPGVRALATVRRHTAAVRPQIIHTHLLTSDIVGGLVARSLAVPLVSTIHEMGSTREDPGIHARHMVVRLCASRLIAVSEAVRAHYLRQGWAREDQIVTIHNGIDVTAEPGAGRDVRRELGLAQDAFVVGMVSALRPEKGHELAIAAVARLRQRFPKLRLLIVGAGAPQDGANVARLAASLGDAAVLAGARMDVMRVFDALDLCLHTSHADAFPTTLIEAMAASTPILAAAVGGVPEIVADGTTGALVPAPAAPEAIASRLAGLIEDAPQRHALARAARRDYENRFTAEPWVERTRALYDQVLAERRPARRLWARGPVVRAGGSVS